MGKKERSFDDTMHIYGRVFASIGVIMMLLVPVFIGIYFKAVPDWGPMMMGVLSICLVYLPSSLVEFATYAPMLGTGASYLAFITGNLSNLKIPCAMSAREIVGVEFGTKENDIISTLSVAISALVTTLVLAVGVVLLVPLAPLLYTPTMQPAFNVVLPALFGALAYTYFSKIPKVAVIPFVLAVALCLIVPSLGGQVTILILVFGAISIGIARFMFKKNMI